jgi:hypothetical protein
MSAAPAGTSQQAIVEAALVLLERMGLSPADLTAVPRDRPTMPTFAEADNPARKVPTTFSPRTWSGADHRVPSV